jgi:predicted DsbA family dithiol-disulfide isomerase
MATGLSPAPVVLVSGNTVGDKVELMKKRIESILSVVLTVSAVAMASVFVWRQILSGPTVPIARAVGVPSEPEYYPDWRAWLADATPLDEDSAPVAIIVFSDLECPFCGQFHEEVLKKTKDTFGSKVVVFFIHLPLNIHRFAELSAVAAECAASQDRFSEYVEVLFRKRDSIGLKSWGSYAVEAAVSDSAEYQSCVDGQEPLQRVKAGRALADSIGITGTPTIFVNGWRLPKPPEEDELAPVIQDILDGRDPFPNRW